MTSIRMALVFACGLAAMVPSSLAQCGEPPTPNPCYPRVIPGAPGAYEVVMGVASAQGAAPMACGYNPGHGVWFSMTPTAPGMLTFSTCHPSTTYDTVVQVFRSTGDCEFPLRLDELCSDDSLSNACINPCGGYRGSEASFTVSAGTTYLFEVGSYNNNAANCTLCLGVRVTLCSGDSSPPLAEITSPTALGCVCDLATIVGTASDPDGTFKSCALEYRSAGSNTWLPIMTSTTPVTNNTLGFWNTSALPHGWYYVRLTVENTCKLVNTAVTFVIVDQQMESMTIRAPSANQVVGGWVCADGTVWDQCPPGALSLQYQPIGGGFNLFDVVNTPWIITDELGRWDTRRVVDGQYRIRASATDSCGNAGQAEQFVVVDNTAPIATITSPLACEYRDGVVQVRGTANDAQLAGWQLYYSGGDANGWVLINSGATPVIDSVLGNWNTTGLRWCAYTLRLVVTDTAVVDCASPVHNQSEYTVSVNVGASCDIDGDGLVTNFDIDPFVECLIHGGNPAP